jgi:hypothetical protein
MKLPALLTQVYITSLLTDIKIWVAVIGALTSLTVALISYFGSRRAQNELALLKAALAERKSENDARRDYEYEARKRLYEQCEPLLFQLYEAAENARYRVHSLARTARSGDLGPENSWLNGPSYYMRSTIYNLLAPVALFKLIQKRLTFVDLTVEPRIRTLYRLTKVLYISFTDPFGFAKLDPPISYNPDHPKRCELREKNPARYWQQGFHMGELDFAAEGLIAEESTEPARLKTFGEFDAAYCSEDPEDRSNLSMAGYLFLGFHPMTRPVLWRILVAEAHLCRVILEANRIDSTEFTAEPVRPISTEFTAEPVRPIPRDERSNFDWRQASAEATDVQVLVEPFSVAEEYLRRQLQRFVV